MNERNYSIDKLKFLCSILVVFLHTEWILHDVILPITRCAVPCFFIISGYLLFEGNGIAPQRLKKNLLNIIKITLFATILYFLWSEFVSYVNHNSLLIPSLEDLKIWLLLNDCPFGFHLWYLYAYFYVLIFVAIVNRFGLWKVLFYLTPILFLIDLLLGTYGKLLFDVNYPYIYFRNFLFVGIPYFSIGALLKYKGHCENALPRNCLISFCLLLVVSSFWESYFLGSIGKETTRSNYLSSILLAVFLFLFTLKNKTASNHLSTFGSKDSLYIYIYHPIIMAILSSLTEKLGLSGIYYWIEPIVVAVLTLVVVIRLRKNGLVLK